jgi:hypothetical protein
MAKCNVYHFKRFLFFPKSGIKRAKVTPIFFTIFPVARDNKVIRKIEQDLELLIHDLIPELYTTHGKSDMERWNTTLSEIESEFATKATKNKEHRECRRLCLSLSDKLREYFSKTRL